MSRLEGNPLVWGTATSQVLALNVTIKSGCLIQLENLRKRERGSICGVSQLPGLKATDLTSTEKFPGIWSKYTMQQNSPWEPPRFLGNNPKTHLLWQSINFRKIQIGVPTKKRKPFIDIHQLITPRVVILVTNYEPAKKTYMGKNPKKSHLKTKKTILTINPQLWLDVNCFFCIIYSGRMFFPSASFLGCKSSAASSKSERRKPS